MGARRRGAVNQVGEGQVVVVELEFVHVDTKPGPPEIAYFGCPMQGQW